MDITITFSDIAAKGLQRLATDGGHEDIKAFCYAILIAKAGEGIRLTENAVDAVRLAKIAAAPKELRDQIDAISIAAVITPAEEPVK